MFIISLAILILVATIWFRRRHKELLSSLHFEQESTSRLKISVVVSGVKSVEYISSMLALSSASFELIVVAPFFKERGALHALAQRFSLIKTHYTPNGVVGSDSIKGLYRSFRRIYSRLVVVDCSHHDHHHSPLEIGASVSKYDYILHIYSHRVLQLDAIDNLLLELATRPEGSVESLESMLFERFKLYRRESILGRGGQGRSSSNRSRLKINYRILK